MVPLYQSMHYLGHNASTQLLRNFIFFISAVLLVPVRLLLLPCKYAPCYIPRGVLWVLWVQVVPSVFSVPAYAAEVLRGCSCCSRSAPWCSGRAQHSQVGCLQVRKMSNTRVLTKRKRCRLERPWVQSPWRNAKWADFFFSKISPWLPHLQRNCPFSVFSATQ